MKKPSFKYKIVEPNDDIKKAVIEKSGTYSEKFTLEDCEKQRINWSKEKVEFEGQLVIEKQKADNIAEHHPFVTKLSEEEQYTVWMYYEANRKAAKLKQYIEQRVNALDVYIKEEEQIMQALGFAKTTV